MKKYAFALVLLGLFAFGCGGSEGEETSPEEQAKIEQEAMKNDSVANEMEKVAAEIKQTSASLSQLLEEIEN